MPKHPCQDGLTEECFKAYPKWAERAFAYRLLLILLGKEGTKALQKIASWPATAENLEWIEAAETILTIISENVIGEGATIATGVELPDGSVIPPDYEMTEEVFQEAVATDNYMVEPEPITVDPDTGATSPMYIDISTTGRPLGGSKTSEEEHPYGYDDYIE